MALSRWLVCDASLSFPGGTSLGPEAAGVSGCDASASRRISRQIADAIPSF